MNRRRFLRATATAGILGPAGCTSSGESGSPALRFTPSQTEVPAETSRPASTPASNSDTIFVDADKGSKDASGTEADPLRSVQTAMEQALPGQTVYVKPGEYREVVLSRRHGEPDAPITLTGSKDAVLRNHPDEFYTLRVRHNHIHVTGISITGLRDPTRPDEVSAYAPGSPIQVRPLFSTDEYLEDVVIAPHGLGNSRGALLNIERTKDSEVGPFRVTGPAGAEFTVGDKRDHNGEIVYIGTAINNLGTGEKPWEAPDLTRNIHVHHIDNSAGYRHSEIVNTKEGAHKILIEYCSDYGGSMNTEYEEGKRDGWPASVRIQGSDTVVRWCDLRNGIGHGISIAGSIEGRGLTEDQQELVKDFASDNSIYGNRIVDHGKLAIAAYSRGIEAQRVVCGNEYTGETHGDPDKPCDDDIPETDTVGHLGGDSPWK